MKVIKRDGRLQDFNRIKIRTSIENAGMDAAIKLTVAESELISKDVEKILLEIRKEDGITSFLEISAAVRIALIKFGYRKIATEYEESNKNAFLTVDSEGKEDIEVKKEDSEKTQIFNKI